MVSVGSFYSRYWVVGEFILTFEEEEIYISLCRKHNIRQSLQLFLCSITLFYFFLFTTARSAGKKGQGQHALIEVLLFLPL
jgi:hypothetical protein